MSIPRSADAIKCSCGGYAESVEPTHAEKMQYDCGRYQLHYRLTGREDGYACCAAAFVCAVCGNRITGTREAPEMD